MRAIRNVLFGIVAVQMNFIDRRSLVAGLQAWTHAKDRALGEILVELSALDASDCQLLEALVDKQLVLHEADSTRSLAALSSIDDLRLELASLGDEEITRTLPHVSSLQVARATSPGTAVSPGRAHLGGQDGTSTEQARFTVLRHHADGGLGQIAVAMDQELSREVALKQIKEEFADDPRSQARFLMEAQITGGLEHPGIVPIYSLGRYADGRPYYAMRLVQGKSLREAITDFHDRCDPSRDPRVWRLGLRKLLAHFLDICNAIEYAHSRGVLHRDLKPANVMLGRFGETLVVDWGLAKVLGKGEQAQPLDAEETLRPPSAESSDPTLYGAAHGTPAYMSPEQAEGQLDKLSPASDVYSLGATLYHLLTGKPPFHTATSGEDITARILRGDFPPPRALKRRIPPPLEAICLRAMSRDPLKRYPSPRSLANDLEHYLADERVSAFREPFPQRMSRLARRHKSWTQAIAVALLVVSVVSATAALVVMRERNGAIAARNDAVLARRQESEQRERADLNAAREKASRIAADQSRELAEAAQARAEVEALSAKQVSDFLVGLFQSADPIGLAGSNFAVSRQIAPDASVREVVDLGTELVLGDTDMDPLMRAKLLDQIGVVYLSLGVYEDANRLITQALEIRRERLPRAHPDLAASLTHAGALRFLLGYRNEAAQLLRDALQVYGEIGGAPMYDESTAHYMLGWTISEITTSTESDSLEAQQHMQRALEIRQSLRGDSARDLAVVYVGIAIANYRNEDLSATLQALLQAVEILSALPGGEHAQQAVFKIQSMITSFAAGRSTVGTRHGREAVAEIAAALGPDHPLCGALTWYIAREIIQNDGDRQIALDLLDRVEASWRGLFGEHPRFAYFLFDRGMQFAELKRYDEARQYLGRALELERKTLGEQHPETAQSLIGLAQTHYAEGNRKEAEQQLRAALAILRQTLGAEHRLVAETLNELAVILDDEGRWEESEALFREAWVIRRKQLAPGDPKLAISRQNLAALAQKLGKWAEAEHLLRDLYEERRKEHGERHAAVANSLADLAILAQNQGQLEQAEKLHRDALQMRRELLGPDHEDVAWSLSHLGLVVAERGDLTQAEQLQRQALAIRRARLSADDPAVATTLSRLADVLRLRREWEQSESLFRESLALRRQSQAEPATQITALLDLAFSLREGGKLDEAESLLREALELAGADAREQLRCRKALAMLLIVAARFDEASELCRAATEATLDIPAREREPANAIFARLVALVELRRGNLPEAVSLSRQAVTLAEALSNQSLSLPTRQTQPVLAQAYALLAACLVTNPVRTPQTAAEALTLARSACELTDWKHAECLAALAAAHAANGDFIQAVEQQVRALSLAVPRLTGEMQQQLDAYRAGTLPGSPSVERPIGVSSGNPVSTGAQPEPVLPVPKEQ